MSGSNQEGNPALGDIAKQVVDQITKQMTDMGLNTVSKELLEMKEMITTVTKGQTELEASLDVTKKDMKEAQAKIKQLEDENKMLRERLEYNDNKTEHIEKQLDTLVTRTIQVEAHTMKENLVFHNISEKKGENTREVLITFLKEQMSIDESMFKIDESDPLTDAVIWIRRCHRFGAGSAKQPRAIVAVMTSGIGVIMRHTNKLAGVKAPCGRPYFVNTQLPKELAENKRKVAPIYQEYKKAGKKPKYVGRGDVLAVDDKIFTASVPPPNHASPKEIIAQSSNVQISSTMPIQVQGSEFVAHKVKISQPCDVIPALHAIKYSSRRIATASHNIYAVRINMDMGMVEYEDDDGEYGGSKVIMKALRDTNTDNELIVVTRWYGGTNIGKQRFDAIERCAKIAIKQ